MFPPHSIQKLLAAALALSSASCQLVPWTEWQNEPPLSAAPGLAPGDISGHQIRFTPADPHSKTETYNFLHGTSVQKARPTFAYAHPLEPWMQQIDKHAYRKTGADTAIVSLDDNVHAWSTCVQRGERLYKLTFLTPHSGTASYVDLSLSALNPARYTFRIEPAARLPKRIGIRGGFVPDKAAPQP